MPKACKLISAICISVIVTSAVAQDLQVDGNAITGTSEVVKDSRDLELLKKSKWIVTEIERDGEAIPAQFGQKEGDIITFKKQGDSLVLG